MSSASRTAVTRHRHATWSAAGLVGLKGAARVSLVVPARDEAPTVGGIVAALREALVETVPLVDELIVIDSDSTDETARVAREAGATVYAAGGIRPDLGPGRGKGEALWKSLFVTTGDVLVFIDADLVEWGPHFVVGLLGPLLTDPDVQLVKAAYDRPMVDAAGHVEESGGRVTELVARPLLALHRPTLGDLVQPLAGEWAVRRSALERLRMPRGYGVEIAALLDIEESYGAAGIAEVDLGRRTHRHHRHDALGPMALQVLAAVRHRAEPARAREADVILRRFERGPGGFDPRDVAVDIAERPPAREVAR